MKRTNLNWQKTWHDMPTFYIPTRDTSLRNSYDVNDFVNYNKNTLTTLFPKYPIYIVSKGRYKRPLTSLSLEKLNIPYKIVIEPHEYRHYSKTIPTDKILVLPFSNLGQGSIPARNWILEHAILNGHKRHWILDDNISGFGTQKYGRRINTSCGDFFAQCESFVDKFKNVALAGIRYRFHHNYSKSPYIINTRIYSCILIDNSISFRWRGKYNEDTDLSIRILKDGLCTVLFTWCYCNKTSTMVMKGGNTDELYSGDGRKLMAESLKNQHPDIVKITKKWGRYQHQVNFKMFCNQLKEK